MHESVDTEVFVKATLPIRRTRDVGSSSRCKCLGKLSWQWWAEPGVQSRALSVTSSVLPNATWSNTSSRPTAQSLTQLHQSFQALPTPGLWEDYTPWSPEVRGGPRTHFRPVTCKLVRCSHLGLVHTSGFSLYLRLPH